MKRVFLSVGSNLGDRQKNLERGISILREHPQIKICKISKWYETDPLTHDQIPQPKYLNGALKIQTNLSPQELLKILKEIEKTLGRKMTKDKWQPRPIDLDILLYENEIVKMPTLKIPHPEMLSRPFVLRPLAEIAPETLHPLANKTIATLAKFA